MDENKTWIKLHVGFFDNRKVRQLSPSAVELYLWGLCYSMEHMTDGCLTKRDLRCAHVALKLHRSTKLRCIKQLVDVGLWNETDNGWHVPGFLKWNPSREQMRAKRRASRNRVARHRAAVRNDDVTLLVTRDGNALPGPDVTRPRVRERELLPSSKTFTSVFNEGGGGGGKQQQREDKALDLLAARDLDAHRDRGRHVGNVAGFIRTARSRRVSANGAKLVSLAADHPDWSPEQLAAAIEPPAPPIGKPPEYEPQGLFTGVKPDFAALRRSAGLDRPIADDPHFGEVEA